MSGAKTDREYDARPMAKHQPNYPPNIRNFISMNRPRFLLPKNPHVRLFDEDDEFNNHCTPNE